VVAVRGGGGGGVWGGKVRVGDGGQDVGDVHRRFFWVFSFLVACGAAVGRRGWVRGR
jgi:hypothetical protein